MNATPKTNRSAATLKFCAAAALLLAAGAPGHADALSDLTARVAQLESTAVTQQNTINTQASAIVTLTAAVNYLKAHPTPGPQGPAGPQGPVGPKGANSALTPTQQSIFNLLSITGSDLTLTGNLHIINGMGATNGMPKNPYSTGITATNGLGNLIIGYNLSRSNGGAGSANKRTGSHNLIIGDMENYTGFGGIVSGIFNTQDGPWSSILGGQNNHTVGAFSSIGGGDTNTTLGINATVAGGLLNTSKGDWATVAGGHKNNAYSQLSSVGGGLYNYACGVHSTISGGEQNFTVGESSSISGGYANQTSAQRSTVSGGYNNYEDGDYSVISGGAGIYNTQTKHWSAGGDFEGLRNLGEFQSY
ncbi:hypothetical protein CCAX7_18070 [Capsulimonas corticalis]|uniref:Uncharacterized protein n=1 Tax=Capsulimonas corticalis TaxID=2219043 RepID=A0A402D724_9BACT|nr:hypothetical protein [Capsulimonas corticalis]BDI29756.1 hypothetical protein CCAX7_18070 [Capsulimonas corticalis]